MCCMQVLYLSAHIGFNRRSNPVLSHVCRKVVNLREGWKPLIAKWVNDNLPPTDDGHNFQWGISDDVSKARRNAFVPAVGRAVVVSPGCTYLIHAAAMFVAGAKASRGNFKVAEVSGRLWDSLAFYVWRCIFVSTHMKEKPMRVVSAGEGSRRRRRRVESDDEAIEDDEAVLEADAA